MKAIIVEDEKLSLDHLALLIEEADPSIELVGKLGSVSGTLKWLSENSEPDLIFLDIELSDGTCFDILEHHNLKSRIIFTTAYDQHALKAFNYNSISYLLKPITREKIEITLSKVNLYGVENVNSDIILEQLRDLKPKHYKHKFLIHKKDEYIQILVEDIAYFLAEDGATMLYTVNGKKYVIDYTIDALEKLVSSDMFFRVNRKMLLNQVVIIGINTHFNRKLKLSLSIKSDNIVFVSKERVANFKDWMEE